MSNVYTLWSSLATDKLKASMGFHATALPRIVMTTLRIGVAAWPQHRTCARVVHVRARQQQQQQPRRRQQQHQGTHDHQPPPPPPPPPATSVAGRHRVEVVWSDGGGEEEGGVVQARTSWKARERSEASEASTSWSMGLNLTALTLSQPHSKVAVGEPRVSSHRRMTGPEVAKMGSLAL